MNKINKISIILSVFNGEEYLKYAIESIQNQTFIFFDFIIVDNGSTDNTPKILEEFREKDPRVKVITLSKTLSYAEGRTIGIMASKTDWFALMDADDISMKERIESQIKFINSSNIDNLGAIGTWGEYINRDGRVLGMMKTGPTTISIFNRMYKNNEAIILIDPSSLINKEAFLRSGGYRKKMNPPCDLDLWYRLSENGYAIIAIPQILFQYRVHAASNSVKKTMFQRKITHYVNYNMRLRRQNKLEITREEYFEKVWSNIFYKFPRFYNDFVMTIYKKTALNYAEYKYINFICFALLTFLLNPKYLLKKFLIQNKFLKK